MSHEFIDRRREQLEHEYQLACERVYVKWWSITRWLDVIEARQRLK